MSSAPLAATAAASRRDGAAASAFKGSQTDLDRLGSASTLDRPNPFGGMCGSTRADLGVVPAEAVQRTPEGGWILALHSSSDCLGIALQERGGHAPPRLAGFPLGRALANELIPCLESLLPAAQWPCLSRLAVAIGPGGFTGTRLTVSLARTLAQQLDLPLDGVGSFLLIARRRQRLAAAAPGPFWVEQDLPRRGIVAGLYGPAAEGGPGVLELVAPRLYRDAAALAEAEAGLRAGAAGLLACSVGTPPLPRCPALVQQPEDVAELLRCSREADSEGRPAPWTDVLPLYPTSPVDPAA